MPPRLSASNNRKTDRLIQPLYLREEVTLLDARLRGLEVVTAIADTVYQERDFVGVIGQAIDLIIELTQFKGIAIYGEDERNNRLDLISYKGISPDHPRIAAKMALSDSFSGIAIKEKRIINSVELGQDPRIDQQIASALEKEGNECVIAVPMMTAEHVIGVINLIFAGMRPLTDDENQILLAIAKTIGLAFINARYVSRIEHEIKRRERAEIKLQEANARLEDEVIRQTREINQANEQLEKANDELRRQIKQRHYESITDPLSGLYSTPYFDVRIRSEIDHAQRYQRPFTLLLIDVDAFGEINDRLGHQSSNDLLGEIGKAIRNNIRSVDSGFRFIGESFVVILPETELDNSQIVAERIQESANHISLPSNEINTGDITVCIGMTQFHSGDNEGELVKRLQQIAKHAKNLGKSTIAKTEEQE